MCLLHRSWGLIVFNPKKLLEVDTLRTAGGFWCRFAPHLSCHLMGARHLPSGTAVRAFLPSQAPPMVVLFPAKSSLKNHQKTA